MFYAPSQPAIDEDYDYEHANEKHREEVGHGLSQQAFHLGDAIRAVGEYLEDHADDRIRESHPEVCFLALNGQPVSWPKTTTHGREFRLTLLMDVIHDARTIYEEALEEYLRKQATRDDIIDSMVLAWAATQDTLVTIPPDVADDEPRIYSPDLDLPIRFEG